MRVVVIFLATTVLASAQPKGENADKSNRLPVPPVTEQAKAEKTIKDLFKAEYAKKKKDDMVDLARKLLKQADESKDDQAAQFVLLREARDLAARAGDVETAGNAADEMTKLFAVPPLQAKLELLEQVDKAFLTPDALAEVLELGMHAVDEAVFDDDYALAAKFLKLAQSAASKTKSAANVAAAAARGKDIERIKATHDKIMPDLETLKTKTDDAGANGRVGRFYCFQKGDWKRGLPLAAQSDDDKLKSLAAKDLKNPESAAERTDLADAWWDYAQGLDKTAQVQIVLHAAAWYNEALGELSGLAKTRVEKRIADADNLAGRSTNSGVAGGWLIVFRSSDAGIWNTDVKKSVNHQAIRLDRVPEKVRYLKLTDCKRNSYVVVDMTRQRLGISSEENGYGWNGTGKLEWKGHHLGVYDRAMNSRNNGDIAIWEENFFTSANGWGFGHHIGVGDRTAYAWAGKEVPKVVLEIAVKTTALTADEAKHLLRKKK